MTTATAADRGAPAPAEPERTELAKAARSGSLSFAGALIGALGGFVLIVLVSRGLGPYATGVFSMLVAIFMTASVAGRFGADSALVRLLPTLRATGQTAAIVPTIRAALIPTCIATTVLAAVVWWLAPVLASWLLGSTEQAGLLRLIAALVPLSTGSYLALAATRGLETVKPLVLVENIIKPALRCVLVAAVLLIGSGVYGVTVAWAVATVLGVGLAGYALHRSLRPLRAGSLVECESSADKSDKISRNSHTQRADGRPARELWQFALPRAGAQICEIVGLHVGVVLAGVLGSTSDAGVYNAVLRLVLAGTLAMQALRIAVAPQLARLLASGRLAQAQAVHQACTGWVVLLSWPVYVLMVVWPTSVLTLFGAEFTDGAPWLCLLALAMLYNLGTGNVGTVLLMSGRSGANVTIAVVALTVQIGVAVALAPWLGIMSVVLGKALVTIGENLAMERLVRHGEKIRTFGRPVWTAMGLALGTFAVPALFIRLWTDKLPVVLVTVALSAAVYVVAIIRLRSVLHCDELLAVFRHRRLPVASLEESHRASH